MSCVLCLVSMITNKNEDIIKIITIHKVEKLAPKNSHDEVYLLREQIGKLPDNLDPCDKRWQFGAYICGPFDGFCDNARTYTGKKVNTKSDFDNMKTQCSCGGSSECGKTIFSTKHIHQRFGHDINHQINYAIRSIKEYFSRDPPSIKGHKKYYDICISPSSSHCDKEFDLKKRNELQFVKTASDFKLKPFIEDDIEPEYIDGEIKRIYEDNDFITPFDTSCEYHKETIQIR